MRGLLLSLNVKVRHIFCVRPRCLVAFLRGQRGCCWDWGELGLLVLIVVFVGAPVVAVVVLRLGLDPFSRLLPVDIDLVVGVSGGLSGPVKERRGS